MQVSQNWNPSAVLSVLQPGHFCLALVMSEQAKHDVVNYEQAKPVHSDIELIFAWKCALTTFASKFCPIFLNYKQLKNTELLILCWVDWVDMFFAMFFLKFRPVFDEIFVFFSKFRYMKTLLPINMLIFFNSSERG